MTKPKEKLKHDTISKRINSNSKKNNQSIKPSQDSEEWLPVPRLTLRQASLVVAVASFLCYWKGQFADFTFDDNSAILNNADVSGTNNEPFWALFENDFWGTPMASKLSHKSYRPLTVITYRLNHVLAGGFNAHAFHVVNLVLHTVNCVLLLRVFSIFFAASNKVDGNCVGSYEETPRRSLLAGLLFAVHPIHTESVSLLKIVSIVCSRSRFCFNENALCKVFFLTSRRTDMW